MGSRHAIARIENVRRRCDFDSRSNLSWLVSTSSAGLLDPPLDRDRSAYGRLEISALRA